MDLFGHRYLCLIAFLFIFASLLAFELPLEIKLIALALLLVALTVAAVLFFAVKEKKFARLVILLAVAALLFGTIHSLIFVSIPTEKAQKYAGEFSAELEILSLEYSDESASEYNARLIRTANEEPNIKVYLICEFHAELSPGERIIARVDAARTGSWGYSIDKDALLVLRVDETQPILHAKAEDSFFLSPDGLRAASAALRESFCRYVDEILGEDSPLVKGMLVNDKSDMPTYTKAQFSRSGAAHILAVSGLHVSLLLGALELLLKRLLAPKGVRIGILSVAGVLLLALTDFSPSAVRSVLMLFALYVNYLFAEESDAPTSLFVAVALIILFSPFSVTDVGMWMSFCATLGLVSVFPIFEKRLPRIKKKRGIVNLLLRAGVLALKAMLITVVANVFTLPIMFYCFGYVSLSAVPCNLLLTPLTALFLPLSVLTLIFGKIALIGDLLLLLCKGVGDLILATVGLFADLRGGTLSLEYPFVPPLIVIFTLAMAVLMVIKLRKKLFIALPPLALVASFAICLGIFAAVDREEIKYVGWGENEMIYVERAGVSSVCDLSTGTASAYNLLLDELCPYSTEIENYVLTHPHSKHPTMLRRLYDNKVIRRLYLPLTSDGESLGLLKEIYAIATEYSTEVIFYKRGESIPLSSGVSVEPCFVEGEDGLEVFLRLSGEDDILTYTDEHENELAFALGDGSRYFLLGAHGRRSAGNEAPIALSEDTRVIFATEGVAESSRVARDGRDVYVIGKGGGKRELVIYP